MSNDSTEAQQMFTFAPTRAWLKMLREHSVEPAYRGRAAAALLTSAATAPLRLAETALYGRRLRDTRVEKDPVYIVGYGRSGTTHLHNLMSRDPQLAYVTTFQASVPGFCLLTDRWLKGLLAKGAPLTRPMDNVRIDMDMPQEEEVAVASSSELSFLHYLSFPADFNRFFYRYVMMQGISERELEARWAVYDEVLKKATILGAGKRLLLKSPTNTGHTEQLRHRFPDARFVHIYRNPYVVYQSIMHLYRKLLPAQQLRAVRWEEIESNTVEFYRVMMGRFLDVRGNIKDGRLTEVQFEQLELEPLEEIERIYGELELPGFEQARPEMERYLGTLESYQKNAYVIDDAVIARVNEKWGFAVDALGYERLSPGRNQIRARRASS